MWPGELNGFRRDDGRCGVRNHVIVMAAADNVNPLARQLADAVPHVTCLPASYGRGQLGEDFELALRAMAGLAAHPNVAGGLVVSFEPESAARIAQRVEKLGRRAEVLSLLEEGGLKPALERGIGILSSLWEQAAGLRRESITVADLLVGLECGGSDTTSGLFGNPSLGAFTNRLIDNGGTAIFSEPVECLGGEAVLEARARTPEVARRIIATVRHYNEIANSQGIDIVGTNPTPDNMAGGLTTIEEKSLGALAKTGNRPIEGVLAYGEKPSAPGLWFMDAPAAAVENLTAIAAAGAQVLIFVTGSGNPVGHTLAPTAKLCANPETVQRMPFHIDMDLSDGLFGAFSAEEAGERIARGFVKWVNGAEVAAETLGYLSSNISRIGESV